MPFEKILVVVDGTESAVKAAEYAIRLARVAPAKLTAVSVVDTETLRKLMSAHILVEPEVHEFEVELRQSQGRQLEFVARLAKKAGVEIETVLGKGLLHAAVLAEQKGRGADMIVIGGFHCTVTKLDLIAHERQLILDGAACPVLVVR
jgi:nucleotide-binding universal stress UspA family protein